MYFGITVLIIMIIAAVTDLRCRQIPLLFIGAAAAASILRIICGIYSMDAEFTDILMALSPGAVLILIAFLTREGVGYGDGLLVLAAGPALGGYAALFGTIAALFANGIFSGVMLALRRAGKMTRIPFVPFLALGMGVMLLAKV